MNHPARSEVKTEAATEMLEPDALGDAFKSCPIQVCPLQGVRGKVLYGTGFTEAQGLRSNQRIPLIAIGFPASNIITMSGMLRSVGLETNRW
jgi:hypothetical protein